ncbi:MAG: transposase [Chloroflexi bacterium]|nr:transposase [Chloroflexota bacterium]MBM4429955.1 transposase [Chloroflexota bacterium]
MLTLFHPSDGRLRVKGVLQATNAVLHPWLKEQCMAILSTLPEPPILKAEPQAALWPRWQQGLTHPITLPEQLPPLRMLLVWDNLAGHLTADRVLWLIAHGIMPLYTPLGGSWLNMTESIQRIIVRRALDGQAPEIPQQIIHALEATAQHWNQEPTPFVWGGPRAARRQRSRQRRQVLGGSGACIHRVTRQRANLLDKWIRSNQTTH